MQTPGKSAASRNRSKCDPASVCESQCDQLSAAQGVDLQHASRVHFRPITHTFVCTKGALFITVTFHLPCSPSALSFISMLPVPPCRHTIPTT